ncbi:MAG TPA: ribosome recycling factor [Bacteroidetes bacterium]|nr:ribosome recycling factor [Bacteroidota bacterium]
MTHEIVKDADARMQKSVEATRDELSKIRTGKASPSLLDPVRVDAYGSSMPLNQVASVSTPDARLITVQPWDKSLIGEIEKAILKADLGLNPANDGQLIRIPIPPLNEERRQEYVKICKKITEDGRIAIRNIRRDANDHLKKMEKNHEMSEDEAHTYLDEIQKITDKHIKELDAILKHKEAEIMEV